MTRADGRQIMRESRGAVRGAGRQREAARQLLFPVLCSLFPLYNI